MKEDRVIYDPETGMVVNPPRQIFLDLTSRCNLKCVTCPVDYGAVSPISNGDMPFSTIERLKPWLDEADSINLNIVGEPLLYPRFREVVGLLASPVPNLHFNTNGLGLSPETCRFLAEKPAGSVVISLDGMESNEPIRGVSYEVLRKKILAMLEAKRVTGLPLPMVGIAYTLMRRNLDELPRVMEDLLPHGLDMVHVQPLIIHYECLVPENIYETAGVEGVLEKCRNIAGEQGARLTLFRSSFGPDERHEDDSDERVQLGATSERYGCMDPYYEIKISHNGAVLPCSYENFQGLNVNDLPLDAIWNHPMYRKLRMRLYNGIFSGRCARCPYLRGSALSQMDALRPGVRHSMEARFLKNYRLT